MTAPRVAHVITGLETGGAEVLLVELLERTARAAERAAVITLRGEGALGPRVRKLGVELTALELPQMPLPAHVGRIEKAIAATGADVVQTCLVHANVLGGLAGRRAGLPVLWGVHSSGVTRATHGLSAVALQMVERRLSWRVPQRIVACSDSAAAFMRSSGYAEERIETVHNGFDLGRFRPDPRARRDLRTELGIAEDALVVGHVARFHPMKDQANLLRAAALASERVPDAHFVLCGNGLDASNPELAPLAAPLGERVHLLGRRSDTTSFYPALDLFALSSSAGEALPLVLGEAMACGIPAVATDNGDSRALIGDTGRVVPVRDASALGEAIADLLALEPQARQALGVAARGRITASYSLDSMVAGYEEAWARVAASASGSAQGGGAPSRSS